MNYTKGEWEAVKNVLSEWVIWADDIPIAKVGRHFDAHLIKAAPAMYEALKEIASCKSNIGGDIVDIAQKTLAKVEELE